VELAKIIIWFDKHEKVVIKCEGQTELVLWEAANFGLSYGDRRSFIGYWVEK